MTQESQILGPRNEILFTILPYEMKENPKFTIIHRHENTFIGSERLKSNRSIESRPEPISHSYSLSKDKTNINDEFKMKT